MMTDDRTYTAYALSSMADCGSPDGPESPGALWLTRVADDALELIDENPDSSVDDLTDDIAERVDSLVPIYTHERWTVFVDLSAYNEDIGDLGGPTYDMTADAAMALYLIAERLYRAILDDRADDTEDDDTED